MNALERIEELKIEAKETGELMFMGIPDIWYESTTWWCKNNHRSCRFLKSELKGDVCLECGENVRLGPREIEGIEPL